MQQRARKILLKTIKVTAWILVSVTALLLVVIALIQLPPVQDRITERVVSFLEEKLGTAVQVERLYISFPKRIVLESFYLEDQAGDTIAYVGKLEIDTDLWSLLDREVQLNDIALSRTTTFIKRNAKDSSFNFDYIVDAFAGDATPTPDTPEKEDWTITLRELSLDDVSVAYDDALTGTYAAVDAGALETNLDVFELETLTFGVGKLDLTNTTATLVQAMEPPAAEAETEPGEPGPNLSFEEVNLHDVHLRYSQQALAQDLQLDIGEISLDAEAIDLEKQMIRLDAVRVTGTRARLRQGPSTATPAGSSPATNGGSQANTPPPPERDWTVSVKTLLLHDNSIKYDDDTQPHQPEGIDYGHLWITGLHMDATDITMRGLAMGAAFNDLSMRDKSGFAVTSFRGAVRISDDSAHVSAAHLTTGQSILHLNAWATYPSLDALRAAPGDVALRAKMDNSHIAVRDILFINHSAFDSLPLEIDPNEKIFIDASVNGTLNNLDLHHLRLNTLSETSLDARGSFAGLAGEAPTFDVRVEKFYSTRADIENILPDTLLPDSMALPAWININAQYRGGLTAAHFNTFAASSYGSLEVNGEMNLDSTSAARGYRAAWALNDFNVGELLMQPDTYGLLSVDGKLRSDGLTPEEMRSAMEATITSFFYQGHEYRDFRITASLEDDILRSWAELEDPNLDFAWKAEANFQGEVPRYKMTFDLQSADFEALKLSERPLKARGTLDVDMATADLRVLNGSIGLRKVAIFNGDDLYAVDSLLFASIDQEGRSEITVHSDLLSGNFEGSLNVFTMPAVLREYLDTYYSLHDSVRQSFEEPQHFSFELNLKKTELLTDIILPELETFTPGIIRGEFDSKAKRLDLRLDIPAFQYGEVGVTSLRFRTTSDATALNYNLLIDEVRIDSLLVDGLELNGTIADDSIRANVIVRDSLDYYKYEVGGTFYSRDKHFEFRLDPEQTMLNYVNWSIPRDNVIKFGGEKVIVRNVELSHQDQKIVVNAPPAAAEPMFFGFENLSLEYLTSMVAGKKPVTGVLSGKVIVPPSDDGFSFTADLSVDALSIAQHPWGNIDLLVEQRVADLFDVDFSLVGTRNDIRVDGTYKGGNDPSIAMTARINRFDLSILEPLQQQFADLEGQLQGSLHVSGVPDEPDINGSLTLANASFFSNFLQTAFQADRETLRFDSRGIVFDAFALADTDNNEAVLKGRINTENYRAFSFNLDFTTQNFQLLNTAKGDNDLFYGLIHLDSYARIRGTMANPVVNMEISLAEGDHLTYIVPQSQASILEQQGIVTFVDKSFKADPFIKKIQPELEDTVKTTFRGINLTAKVELTEGETFTMIIDPTTEDQLTIRGNATLTLQMDQTGDMQLAGRYEIAEGTYNFSFYKFVKRSFDIQEGSSITWTGDILNANMDITAIYRVETSPIELISNQVTDPAELDRFRQRMPFIVLMDIAGQLLTPEIAFRLDMPLSERNTLGGNVYARLQDINTRESDLNKQVFALLILKRFISDDPFENQAGSGLEGTARTSVSKILTEQLNQLTENIRGVELSFDVRSYEQYEGGEAYGQTELELGLSKRLLDDRLIIKLSGNVDIEGNNEQREVTDYIGDIALEYLLTEDGRFRVRGFRNSDYDIIDGELIETGAGFIYIKEYNKLKDLFEPNVETGNQKP